MTLTIKTQQPTIFKLKPAQSSELAETDKLAVPTNTEFPINWFNREGMHIKFSLIDAAKGIHDYFAFNPHVQILENGKVKAVFPAIEPPFWNQRDNKIDPNGTCNSSSTAMAIKALGADIDSDDEFVQKVFSHGESTDHDNVNWVVRHYYGIDCQFRYDMSFADLDRELAEGKPVVLGILHRGDRSNPYGGHMICCYRKEPNGYRCHDPYGRLPAYSGSAQEGKGVIYSTEELKARWTVEGPKSGWGRVFNH